jgi:ribonuclease D
MNEYYIDSPEGLNQILPLVTAADWLAVDTEFLRTTQYYPQLCLLQIGTQDWLALIDPLALRDLSCLWPVLLSKRLVFHSAHQDLEIFLQHAGALPQRIFDTQLAAILLKQGFNVSYSRLVENLLGVELDKSHSLTDWSQRPLSEQQIRYAQDDVRYLAVLYPLMLERLGARTESLEADFYPLTQQSTFTPQVESLWMKLRNAMMLKPAQRTLAYTLCQWRENLAQEINRPRRHAASDEWITQLTKTPPRSLGALKGLRDTPHHLQNAHLETLFAAITAGLAMDPESVGDFKAKPKLTDEQKRWIKGLQPCLTQQAQAFNIPPNQLVSHKDLVRFLQQPHESRLMQGWRRWVLGEPLHAHLTMNPIQSQSAHLAAEFRA